MRILKQVGIFIIFLLLATAILSFFIQTTQKIQRSVLINAPIENVYAQIVSLKNFNQWSAWSKNDSTLKNTYQGVDGQPGSSSSWEGDPQKSGKGVMELISAEENKQVLQKIRFTDPRTMEAASQFDLSKNGQQTTVTWTFTVETPRPWNIFNLFYSMDKEMGKDFEDGLKNLKFILDKTPVNEVAASSFSIRSIDYPETKYAMMREQVNWNDFSSYYQHNQQFINEALKNAKTTATETSGLFFERDATAQRNDLGLAMQVDNESDTKVAPPVELITVPASKAIEIDYQGNYGSIQSAYDALDAYLKKEKLTKKYPTIEVYKTTPKENAHVRIIFLVE